jgi:hypothetical protein
MERDSKAPWDVTSRAGPLLRAYAIRMPVLQIPDLERGWKKKGEKPFLMRLANTKPDQFSSAQILSTVVNFKPPQKRARMRIPSAD